MIDKKIIIYSHNGHNATRGNWDEELVNYLLNNNYSDIIHIRFPFGKNSLKSIRLFFYKNKELTIKESLMKFSSPEIISYFKDLIYGFFYGFNYLRNSDFFIGTNNLLILIGLFFKKLGFIKKVAYVVIDYTPIRFSNNLINSVYYFLDKLACYHSDEVWALNIKMLEGREKDGRINLKKVNFKEVPFGNNSLSFKEGDLTNYDKNKIVYFGGIIKNKGSELFVPIVKSLINKGFNNIKFEIIGDGDLEYLKNKIKINNLENQIDVLGRIESQEEINNILLKCGVAIAPYYPENKNNYSYYADPGKIKTYFGCGLPIVITDVPPIAKDIEGTKSGLIANYEANDFADKILMILENYEFYRNNSIKFGRSFDWNNIFDKII